MRIPKLLWFVIVLEIAKVAMFTDCSASLDGLAEIGCVFYVLPGPLLLFPFAEVLSGAPQAMSVGIAAVLNVVVFYGIGYGVMAVYRHYKK